MQQDFESDMTLVAPSQAGAGATQLTHALVWLGEGGDGRRVLIDSASLTIGRVPPCDLVLPSASISRAHCRLELIGSQAVVTDLGSTNGTMVDGRRIAAPTPLQHGAVLQLASHVFSYERRTRREIEEYAALDRDLHEASRYMQSLLPQPIWDGPVRADWLFLPCVQLGGSGFGYRVVAPDCFAFYMVDSAARGTSAAMQSVTLMNLLRQQALPGVDFREPAQVVAGLRALFQADAQNSFVSIWYGVFDTRTRGLRHASAGHFPAFVALPGRDGLGTLPEPGAQAGEDDAPGSEHLPVGTKLLLVSDGICDMIERQSGGSCETFLQGALAEAAGSALPEPLTLHRAVCRLAGSDVLYDDFSALVLDFA